MPEAIFAWHRRVVLAVINMVLSHLVLAAIATDVAKLAGLTYLTAQYLAHVYMMIQIHIGLTIFLDVAMIFI